MAVRKQATRKRSEGKPGTDTDAPVLVASAAPTKHFFVDMITRDISLDECILDLIDNCVDGAHRKLLSKGKDATAPAAYGAFEIQVLMGPTRFEIIDNCGGIPLEVAQNYAFHFGRLMDADNLDVSRGIGLYGIGMKRAAFKIGRRIRVMSKSKKDEFTVDINVDDWLADETSNWDFPISLRDSKLGEDGTHLRIDRLNPGIAGQFDDLAFRNTLRQRVSIAYSRFIERGLTIKVQSDEVPEYPFVMMKGGAFSPVHFKYRDAIDRSVAVEIVAGWREFPGTTDDPDSSRETRIGASGWYVGCNDRMVLFADKTSRTGWGRRQKPRVPSWHAQYSGFVGMVFFTSHDPKKLPWATTKRDVDLSSPVYQRALVHMTKIITDFTAYTNRRKGDSDRARKFEAQAKQVPALSVPLREEAGFPVLETSKKKRAGGDVVVRYEIAEKRAVRLARALGVGEGEWEALGLATFDLVYTTEVGDR